MRKWLAVLAMGVCISLPVVAQQKDAGANESAKVSEAPKTNLFSAPTAVSKSPWALPARARLTPFPVPADTKDNTAPGQLLPRYELAFGYSYVDFHPGDPFNNFNSHGATGSFTYNAMRYLGLTAELGGYDFQRNINPNQAKGSFTTLLFGPRLNLRKFDHFVPFTEF